MKKAVFLDRDGVINKVIVKDAKAYSPRILEDFEFLPDIADQVRRIKQGGYLICIATNQPDIARKKMDLEDLLKMHDIIEKHLDVDEILTCLHDDEDQCLCRKPKAGMLNFAVKKHNIKMDRSFFIGDSWRDMGAAKKAGCKGILIDAGYNKDVDCTQRVECLSKAVDIILKN
jgi:D-glycero-D-manno-heptose 1,7-bisphosphate phosphatase